MSTSPWLLKLTERAEPRLILFALPHAGGGTYSYIPWAQLLPDWIELIAVSLPGRGNRLSEPPLTDMSQIADAVFA